MPIRPRQPRRSHDDQLTVLFLIREESATLSELARRLMITPAAVTGIVDRLEKRGYVRRLPGVADLRTVLLELTDGGRAASLAVHESLVADIAAELSTLTPDQVEELRRGLEVLDGVIQRLERVESSVGE